MSLPGEGVEGTALVYCEGAFGSTYGKTTHGMVRRSHRYRIGGVVDSHHAGVDAGTLLDGQERCIPIVASVDEGLQRCQARGTPATHLVIGLAPDGGRLDTTGREAVIVAIESGLNIVSGLHDFLAEDVELVELARNHGIVLQDVRRPPPRDQLHFFSGRIEHALALRVAVLGTDSAVGKRTTAWRLIDGLHARGVVAELVGTGQTAWLQGARFGVVFDALVNDFVTGEIEHAVCKCDEEQRPAVIVIEGQGSLMNPAYPGGLEVLAAARPHVIVMQHAPARRHYDGFPDYPIHPLSAQIQAAELLSGRQVIAITINSEGLKRDEVSAVCQAIAQESGRVVIDVLREGPEQLAEIVCGHVAARNAEREA